jgi:uncharacterized protein YukE
MHQKRVLLVVVFVFGILLNSVSLFAQNSSSVAGVDKTKFGIYRALAEVAFQSFQESDDQTAAKLARILERTWDHCEGDLAKSSPATYQDIDDAMDAFVKPLIQHKAGKPDPAWVEAAYKEYLDKLKEAEL